MKDEIENSIKVLVNKIANGATADEALKYTQAALNLAHTEQVLSAVSKQEDIVLTPKDKEILKEIHDNLRVGAVENRYGLVLENVCGYRDEVIELCQKTKKLLAKLLK